MTTTPDTPAHTPLPWKHQAGFQNVYALSDGDVGLTIHIAKTNEAQVAGGYAEAEANAAFIVRACNSHYALENALRGLLDEIAKSPCADSVLDSAAAGHAFAALSQAGGASE